MEENRIVLIKGSQSEWYEQVIFVLKKAETAKRKNLVREAEKIINNYMTYGSGDFGSTKLEDYKKSLNERAESKRASTEVKAQKVKKKIDYINLFITVSLIAGSLLIGYLFNGMMH